MGAKVKIWVQPVGGFWNIKHLNTVLYRTRSMDDGIQEANLYMKELLKREEEGTLGEIVVETEEGLIKTIPYNASELED